MLTRFVVWGEHGHAWAMATLIVPQNSWGHMGTSYDLFLYFRKQCVLEALEDADGVQEWRARGTQNLRIALVLFNPTCISIVTLRDGAATLAKL